MSPVENFCANAAADGHHGETIGPKFFGKIPCRSGDVVQKYYPTRRPPCEKRAQIGHLLAPRYRWGNRGYPAGGHRPRERKEQRRIPADKLPFIAAKRCDVSDKRGPETVAPFANLLGKAIARNDREAPAFAGDRAAQIRTTKIRNKKWHAAAALA